MTTPNLALPLLATAQAQKHVTVNEALARLDGLVQLSVKDRDLAAPPASPVEGEQYIVATGANAWSGWDGDVALFSGGAWVRLPPSEGWRVWVEDEGTLIVRMGGAWLTLDTALNLLVRGPAVEVARGRMALPSGCMSTKSCWRGLPVQPLLRPSLSPTAPSCWPSRPARSLPCWAPPRMIAV